MEPISINTNLMEVRCHDCNALLGKFFGIGEIKCRKCGLLNRFGIAPTSAGFEITIEGQRAPENTGVREWQQSKHF